MRNRAFILFTICFNILRSQNLILNPSFSEVYTKSNSPESYTLAELGRSHVKEWYIPEYIDQKYVKKKTNHEMDYFVKYYTSRDKEIALKEDLFFSPDQLYLNNLGFIFMRLSPNTIIQQKISSKIKKGKYCFKLKYKILADYPSMTYSGLNKFSFSFSKTNLSEYYQKELKVPQKIINLSFSDTNWTFQNSPWKRKCFEVNLKGNEEFFSLGLLNNPFHQLTTTAYIIDDLELIKLEKGTNCKCENLTKDSLIPFYKDFNLNEEIFDDSLSVHYHTITSTYMVSSPFINRVSIRYLNSIIFFMKKFPDVKLKLIKLQPTKDFTDTSVFTEHWTKYLRSNGIDLSRVSFESRAGLQNDTFNGENWKDVKIGFVLYK